MPVKQETSDLPTQSSFVRFTKAAFRFSLTIGFFAAAGVAVQLGSQELSGRAEAAPAAEPASITAVQTAPFALEKGYSVTRRFLGQIEAQRSVSVSFELAGQLTEILVDEGDSVAIGQQIATLDTRLLEAERTSLEARKTALEAQLNFATKTVARFSRLSDQGITSQAALDEALSRSDELNARIAEIDAAMTTVDIQLEKSRIYAPFSGHVSERLVDGGESLSPGQVLAQLVEDGQQQVRIGIPLDIGENRLADAKIEIDGTHAEARWVTFLPDVDAATRTRTAVFEFDGATDFTFGQMAQLVLDHHVETPGLWVPVTTLKEGLRGQWTLLAVDVDNIVR